MENNIDTHDLSFNLLSDEERKLQLLPTMMDPFNVPKDYPMINVFSMKLMGKWSDGYHYSHNPFNFKLTRKYLVEDNKVTSVWRVNDDNEYEEVLPYEDGTWDNKLFK